MEDNKIKVDIYTNLKENVLDWYRNAKELKSNVIYCFDCKKSSMNEKEHLLHSYVNKQKYLQYDDKMFDKVSHSIKTFYDESKKERENVIQALEDTIAQLHKDLEILKQDKVKEINQHFEIIENNIKEIETYYLNSKENLEQYFTLTDTFYEIPGKNYDIENSVFLINYEIISIISKQNSQLNENIKGISSTLNNYPSKMKKDIDEIVNAISNKLSLGISLDKYDDLYWDANLRINKYKEHINEFKKIVNNVYEHDKGIKKIEDVINVFDSKQKKGVEFIFNQDFFNDSNSKTINTNNQTITTCKTLSFRKKQQKIRGNSKKRLLSSPLAISNSKQYLATISKTKSSNNIAESNNYDSSNNDNISFGILQKQSEKTIKISKASQDNNTNIDKITLSNRILQRYFAYSILDLYNKTFAPTPERKIFASNLIMDYTTRYNSLKEYAKPIPKTNKISLFNTIFKKLTQVSVPLSKAEHGYSVFPEGCRHIFINNMLYITGGVDSMNTPINIVLCYDTKSNHLIKKPSMLKPHSYHTLEYLDNYECIVVIGGDKNYCCEIFDLFTCTWHMLPELTYWRANANVIFNNVTSDIYVLFGMIEDNRNSDVIEVLELKDIKGGWIKIDYYKNAQFDFTVNYCKVIQFSKDKLLIYGGNDSRVTKKMYGLYLLERNEIVKINDEKDLEEIKRAECGIKERPEVKSEKKTRVKSININKSISVSSIESRTQRTPRIEKLFGRNETLKKNKKTKSIIEDY